MIWRKLGRAMKGQRGFTVMEIIVVLAITGLIGAGAATATAQMLTQGSRNSNYTIASRNTMNAIYWIGRDAQMAQVVTPGGGPGFPLTLSWIEWDNSEHQVIYSIEGDKLRRSYAIDGGGPNQIVVAQYIDSVSENATACSFTGGVLTLKVTTTMGEGSGLFSVTKVREITPRPGL